MNKQQSTGASIIGALVVILGIIYGLLTANAPANTNPANPGGNTGNTGGAVDSNNPSGSTGPTGGLDWIKVYFTDPTKSDESNLSVDRYVTRYVIPVVQNAQQTLDITSFDLNLPVFVNEVVAASKRGVKVRVVYDGKDGNQTLDDSPSGITMDTLKAFDAARIPSVNGGVAPKVRSDGLMHDKIIIADGKTLVMGSWNMSYNDTYRNNNNLLIITNPQIIANYQAKFNELFVDKKFGAKAVVGARTPKLTIGGMQVENYFSPPDNVMDKLVALTKTAQKSIKFMIFTYTDKNLAAAMIDRFNAGVKVEGIIENRGASQGAMPILACAKVPVKVDGNKYTFHHKVIVIDDKIVVTGSFNFTKSADDANDDNVLILYSPEIAQMYLQEYARVSAIAKTPENVTCS